MNLTLFEHDRQFVIDALRRGELDYLENVSEAAEANLFRHLIDRRVLERLAESYPQSAGEGGGSRLVLFGQPDQPSASWHPPVTTPSPTSFAPAA